MTDMEEGYKRLAQEALNEPDPKKALELCEKAFAMGLLLGLGDGTDEIEYKCDEEDVEWKQHGE